MIRPITVTIQPMILLSSKKKRRIIPNISGIRTMPVGIIILPKRRPPLNIPTVATDVLWKSQKRPAPRRIRPMKNIRRSFFVLREDDFVSVTPKISSFSFCIFFIESSSSLIFFSFSVKYSTSHRNITRKIYHIYPKMSIE